MALAKQGRYVRFSIREIEQALEFCGGRRRVCIEVGEHQEDARAGQCIQPHAAHRHRLDEQRLAAIVPANDDIGHEFIDDAAAGA